MTFEELDLATPNGFHDAQLINLRVDYENSAIELTVDFDFSDPDSSDRSVVYKRGLVCSKELLFCTIEQPDTNYFQFGSKYLDISGDIISYDEMLRSELLSKPLPKAISYLRLFVHDWNSFIYIAAENIEVTWISEAVVRERIV